MGSRDDSIDRQPDTSGCGLSRKVDLPASWHILRSLRQIDLNRDSSASHQVDTYGDRHNHPLQMRRCQHSCRDLACPDRWIILQCIGWSGKQEGSLPHCGGPGRRQCGHGRQIGAQQWHTHLPPVETASTLAHGPAQHRFHHPGWPCQ